MSEIGQVETRHPLVMGYQPLVDARAFGVVPVAISAAATEAQGLANLAAMQDAIDWSHETGGAIAHPVDGVTIAGNLREMFLGIEAVGSDVDPRSHLRTGSILVGRMTVAGGD